MKPGHQLLESVNRTLAAIKRNKSTVSNWNTFKNLNQKIKKMRENIIKYFDNILVEKFCVIASTQEQFNLSYEMCCAEDLNDEELDKLYQKVKEVFNERSDF